MALIASTDFTGIYKVSQQSYTTAELTAYIDQMQAEILVDLFGAELYALFVASLDGAGLPTGRFLTLYNAFVEAADSGSGSTFYMGSPYDPYFPDGDPRERKNTSIQSFGMKDMMCGFIYFDFMADQMTKAGPSGLNEPETMTSKNPGSGARGQKLSEKWNRAIKSYQAIQWYMTTGPNASDYPEFKGIAKKAIYLGGAV